MSLFNREFADACYVVNIILYVLQYYNNYACIFTLILIMSVCKNEKSMTKLHISRKMN